MSGKLAGKVCVITGTGGSMGRATALVFAREGASVVGCDVTVATAEDTVEMVQAGGGQMVSMQPCRLSDPADCGALVELAVGTFGRIDVLFNLAAASYFNWLEDITDQEWDSARRDEVDLVFYLTRAAWPHLKSSSGVVVNMASLNASLSFKILPSLAHTTNKAGIVGMTRQLALEGREHGIRANSISPGLIESNATREQLNDPVWAREMLGKTLLGRLGRPEEVANVALFLAADESSYVTGVDIVVDGGMKVWRHAHGCIAATNLARATKEDHEQNRRQSCRHLVQSECIVLERYRDSQALIERAEHIGNLNEAIVATGDVAGELLGEPSAELRANLADGPIRLFTPYLSM